MIGQFDDILGSDEEEKLDSNENEEIDIIDESLESRNRRNENRRIIDEYEKILKKDLEKLNEKTRGQNI
jgi:hypothetical protein